MKEFSIIIIGGGHAGVEAVMASARLGLNSAIITMDKNSIARMSCNPAIGGLGKGHLVTEIDALGGAMGSAADACGIQFKMLNKSKGRAVWSPRAQIDKHHYSKHIQLKINNTKNITVIEGEAVNLCVDNNLITGVILASGDIIKTRAAIVCSGTFLNGLIHIGEKKYPAGRLGEKPVANIAQNLVNIGFKVSRLKTGTPPRLLSSSIDWTKTAVASGDDFPTPFSTSTPLPFAPPNVACNIVETNNMVHDSLFKNLERSAMYSGSISAEGPRYCPSIEDKIVRFQDRPSHQLFLEPEWLNSNQIYLNGFSTSMPESVQISALKAIKGLENVELIRPGYAIEYDYFPSSQLKSTLETKDINGLYFAGQMNGTSGYEEAAAQGLIAGANAALKTLNKDPLILDRSTAYIGVLIDDLITKDIDEPYRMFTSRAEHRLSLRPDNATLRLSSTANKLGLIDTKKYLASQKFKKSIDEIKSLCKKTKLIINNKNVTFFNYLKRPEGTINNKTIKESFVDTYSERELFTAETDIKYEGYVNIENQRVKKLKKLESTKIPLSFNYKPLSSLSTESKEKLARVRPETLGQASRINGVKPSDINLLAIMLKADA